MYRDNVILQSAHPAQNSLKNNAIILFKKQNKSLRPSDYKFQQLIMNMTVLCFHNISIGGSVVVDFSLLLLPLWESVIVLCFVVRYSMSILVLQSS